MLRACLDWARDRLRGRFDYRRLYAAADLGRDHWSIVGPASRAEYEALGRAKLRDLIEQGLTPRSRVLDVGCGTGQLAGPLLDYLDEDGTYCGTDVAPEAVAYCLKRHARSNASFVVNRATMLPLAGPYDVAFLGSVLTHSYPDEVGALLKEVARVLHGRGFALADAFVSDAPSGHAGGRGMVRIAAETLSGLIAEAGLGAAELFATPQRRCRRVMYRLTKA